ncbi:MAG TPA: bifunctional adenosylcobinamide kinase/adenosylcobinamide-phosphate guanylyltransferase [Nocardioidaceae bacterium]|nr:bifunctional adenosylcobinamide kinase/adenosylcobinamide-phosphate guanylyltransferase [Nocardioidaceae bacterium]
MSRTLLIGGARSGKSRQAERLLAAEPGAGAATYVATGYPVGYDEEWTDRVRAHQAARPPQWSTMETTDLVPLLDAAGGPLLVDCLTLWLTRVMDRHEGWDDTAWVDRAQESVRAEVDALVCAWAHASRTVVAVTNEVGQGVVPATAAGRRFRDEMGTLNTRMADAADRVLWCVAGRAVAL